MKTHTIASFFQTTRDCFSTTLYKLKNYGNNPTFTYQLRKTIRSKIVNYKEAINSIYVDENVSFSLNTDQCGCVDSVIAIKSLQVIYE